jgi:hypothetical protein
MSKKMPIELEAMIRDYFQASDEFFTLLDGSLFVPLALGNRPTLEQVGKMSTLMKALAGKNREAAAAMHRLVN